MKHVSNEDYARHLCCSGCNNYVCYTNKKQCPTLKDLLTMAKWKDEQFSEIINALPQPIKDLIKTLAK